MTDPPTLRNTVIAVVGPTCSGKTSLSIELALEFGGEVIACDSRTIYKFMDIGTAKPTEEERRGVAHHMLDVVEPDRVYTVAEYQREGTAALNNIFARGKVPIVCGGTGLYSRALLEGLSIPEVPPQNQLRDSLKLEAQTHGNQALHDKLSDLDPVGAAKIHPNDVFRIIRALEVTLTLGQPFSEATKRKDVPFKTIWIGLTYIDRDLLRTRIAQRMNEQIGAGLEKEARFLYEKYGATMPLLNAVTYKQMINYFDGKCTMEEAIADCVVHNYQLSRNQLIWFRANRETTWFYVDEINSSSIFDRVTSHIKQNRIVEHG
jgi:tRNA dimethylallyltransferase